MSGQGFRQTRLRGMTLIELLIVVAIIGVLIGFAAAAMQPAMAGREMREASRQVNTYVSRAQAMAIEQNRPVGVLIERGIKDLANPGAGVISKGASLQLFIAQVPLAYGGDTIESYATITQGGKVSLSNAGSMSVPGFVKQGDEIKFNYQGRRYRIKSASAAQVTVYGNPTPTSFPVLTSFPVPFQIYRRPIKSSVPPLQMPGATIVDIGTSGVGATGTFSSSGTQPIVIMFGSDGKLNRIYEQESPYYPLSSVHLLIGRIDQIGSANLKNLESRWVSIGLQTGMVSTTENHTGGNLSSARTFARTAVSMGGR